MIAYLPCSPRSGCCLALLLPAVDDGADLVVTRVALALRRLRRRGRAAAPAPARPDARRSSSRTHRTYAAKTLLYAGVLGVAGSVIGVYAAAGLLSVLDVSEAALRGTLPASLGFVAGVTRLTELGSQTLPPVDAGVGDPRRRARGRDVLRAVGAARPTRSRSGSGSTPPCPGRSRSCTRSRGRGCRSHASWTRSRRTRRCTARRRRELSVAVRDMNAFGTDALTALQRTSPAHPERRSGRLRGEPRVRARHRPTHLDVPQRPVRAVSGGGRVETATVPRTPVDVRGGVRHRAGSGTAVFITILVVIGLVLEDTLPPCASWSTSGYRWRRSGSWSTSTASRHAGNRRHRDC